VDQFIRFTTFTTPTPVGRVVSLTIRQHTCAACGRPIQADDPITIEPIVHDQIRYVAVHREHTCYPGKPTEGTKP
jgi:hypothetical protein